MGVVDRNGDPQIDDVTGEVLDHKGRRLTPDGAEIPDPASLAPPIGFVKQPPLHELIRQMVRSETLRQEAEAMQAGSFDDEDDFDVEDDGPDPASPWEENFEPLAGVQGNSPAVAPVLPGTTATSSSAGSAPPPTPSAAPSSSGQTTTE